MKCEIIKVVNLNSVKPAFREEVKELRDGGFNVYMNLTTSSVIGMTGKTEKEFIQDCEKDEEVTLLM